MALKEVGITSRGYTIFVEDNGVGGKRYWSDEIGGGVCVWDTSLACPESLQLALAIEEGYPYKRGDHIVKKKGDYIFEGHVVVVYRKLQSLQYRIVVEDKRGLNLIMNPNQL